MHKHILTAQQIALLPLIKEFAQEFYLVGGTAIALYIGHRRSIDFDLFTQQEIKRRRIKRLIEKHQLAATEVLYQASEQLHLLVNNVKLTFFNFLTLWNIRSCLKTSSNFLRFWIWRL